MRPSLRLLCACLSCVALAACGGSGSSDEQQIKGMFSAIDGAMARGDYAGACSHFSNHQQATIVAGAQHAGLHVTSCADSLTALIKQTGISRSQLAQTFGGGGAPKVRSVSVHGDQATVTYTSKIAGHTYTETDGLVRENGEWKADRIIKRTQGA